MIIQLAHKINTKQKSAILSKVAEIGFAANEVSTQNGNYLVCIGKKPFDIRAVGSIAGVKDVHRVSDDYKLVSRKWKVGHTEIVIGKGVTIGGECLAIMAGPCSIENEAQVRKVAIHLKKNNVRIMRGGVFKPRSSPYSFRGLGIDGLKMFYEVCKEYDLKIISEVMQVSQVDEMYPYLDIFQVGARNSQNFNLLDALGKTDKPVLIKRGLSGTLDELLYSAEYVFSGGNEKLILCERGVRTYETSYRNMLDLNAVPVLKEKTHLPVIVDPSHGVGVRRFVEPLAMAAVVAGADGILIEIHETPEKALSDGQQTLNFEEAEMLYPKLRKVKNYKSFQNF